jgi:hypothetical protein
MKEDTADLVWLEPLAQGAVAQDIGIEFGDLLRIVTRRHQTMGD